LIETTDSNVHKINNEFTYLQSDFPIKNKSTSNFNLRTNVTHLDKCNDTEIEKNIISEQAYKNIIELYADNNKENKLKGNLQVNLKSIENNDIKNLFENKPNNIQIQNGDIHINLLENINPSISTNEKQNIIKLEKTKNENKGITESPSSCINNCLESKDYISSIEENHDLKRINSPFPFQNILFQVPPNFYADEEVNLKSADNLQNLKIKKDLKENQENSKILIQNYDKQENLKIEMKDISNQMELNNNYYILEKQSSIESQSDEHEYYLVERILRFVESRKPLNHVLCGYFFKIFTNLSRLKTTQVLLFII